MSYARKRPEKKGLTLVEVATAIMVLGILVMGSSSYRASAASMAKQAVVDLAAARVGEFMVVSWQGAADPNTFNPTTIGTVSSISITAAASGPDAPSGFTVLGNYKVVVDSVPYFVALSKKDILTAATNQGNVTVRGFNICVAWEHSGKNVSNVTGTDKTMNLTNYK